MKYLFAPLLKTIGLAIASLLVFSGVKLGTTVNAPISEPAPKVQGFNPTGSGTYRLSNSADASDSTINLSSFTEPISNIPYTMTYLGSDIGYGTLDPQNSLKSEFISFTGVTQNSDGSAQLTGVIRGLSRTPGTGGCVASTTLASAHSGQSFFILSNSPCFYSEFAVKKNNENITGSWTTVTPTNSSGIATKGYVDTAITGTTTIQTDKISVAGTAGETISAGQILYLRNSDARWYKASTATLEASSSPLGIAEGSGTAGVAISNGVLVGGLDANQSGLTAGVNYFLGSTAGTPSTATSTRLVGRAKSSTQIYFDPYFTNKPVLDLPNTFTASTTFTSNVTLSTTTFNNTATSSIIVTATSSLKLGASSIYDIGKHIVTLTSNSTTTWTVPSGISTIYVRLIGAGGGGAGTGGSPTNGTWTRFAIGATTPIVGNGGQSGSSQSGGTATGGDVNISGGNGGNGMTLGSGTAAGGQGGSGPFGAGSSPPGAGGKGGQSGTAGGGGGGAGGYAEKMFDVSSTSTIQYVVGTGGAAGSNAESGGNGIIIITW